MKILLVGAELMNADRTNLTVACRIFANKHKNADVPLCRLWRQVDGLTSVQHASQLSPRPPYPYGNRPVPIIRILGGPQCRYDGSDARESSRLVTIPATKSQVDRHAEANKCILQTFNATAPRKPSRLRTCANYSNTKHEDTSAEFRSPMYSYLICY
jgi:hypothetical protein